MTFKDLYIEVRVGVFPGDNTLEAYIKQYSSEYFPMPTMLGSGEKYVFITGNNPCRQFLMVSYNTQARTDHNMTLTCYGNEKDAVIHTIDDFIEKTGLPFCEAPEHIKKLHENINPIMRQMITQMTYRKN